MDKAYLESLLKDIRAQLLQHEQNAAAARGAIQILEHLIQKTGENVFSPVQSTNPSEENTHDE